MLQIASEITICLLLAALIGFIIGYLLGRINKKKVEKKSVTKTEAKKTTAQEENTVEKEIDTFVNTMSEEIQEDEVKIPSSAAIEDVTVALEELESEETAIKPILLDAPKNNTKDPLTTIKGIGPKVEEQLNAAGIFHFEQIANWDEANIQWLEINTTFAHRAKKDLWVNQAKALLS